MNRSRGFTLIELLVVMVIIAIVAAVVRPRITAGFNRVEMAAAESALKDFVKKARIQARRAGRERYVALERERHSLVILGPDLTVISERPLPASIEVFSDDGARAESDFRAIFVSPLGGLRADPVLLRGRAGETRVLLQ